MNQHEISSTLDNLTVIDTIIGEIKVLTDVSESFDFRFRLVLAELISNAIIHGNRYDATKKIFIDFFLVEGKVKLCIKDEGVGFDPFVIPNPTSLQNIEKEGGRGIYLVKSISEEMEYCKKDNCIYFSIKL